MSGADDTRQRIAEACDALGWSTADAGAGRYRLDARHVGMAARVLVGAVPGGGIRVSQLPMALRITSEEAARGVRLFALEANGRLRLVRLSVEARTEHVLHVLCEVVLPALPRLAPWLAEAVEALAVASAETGGALRALATRSIAAAYLGSRPRFVNPPASGRP